jgi:hypothetical protein
MGGVGWGWDRNCRVEDNKKDAGVLAFSLPGGRVVFNPWGSHLVRAIPPLPRPAPTAADAEPSAHVVCGKFCRIC